MVSNTQITFCIVVLRVGQEGDPDLSIILVRLGFRIRVLGSGFVIIRDLIF